MVSTSCAAFKSHSLTAPSQLAVTRHWPGREIRVDATALTHGQFSLFDSGRGLGRYFASGAPQTLTLIPGRYRFGTLFGPTFDFSVDARFALALDSRPGFVTGAGTSTLVVAGCAIEFDATSLTLDQFSLFDAGRGLGRFFPTTSVQPLRLIPGRYRFGTLFGATFEFTVGTDCTVVYDAGLTFLSGAGSATLEVDGFLVNIDARRLGSRSFSLADSGSGLSVPFPAAGQHCISRIPGNYVFSSGFSFSLRDLARRLV